jgi:hypothetical protein
MLFDDFLKTGKFTDCATINNKELYCLPDGLNWQRCNYIKYGQESIGNVLISPNRHYSESMLHQLEKLESQNRKFVYYLKMNQGGVYENFKQVWKSTRREYTIHFNL